MNRCLLWRNSPRHQIPFYVIIFKLVRLFRQLSRRLCFCWHLNHNPRGNWLVTYLGQKRLGLFSFKNPTPVFTLKKRSCFSVCCVVTNALCDVTVTSAVVASSTSGICSVTTPSSVHQVVRLPNSPQLASSVRIAVEYQKNNVAESALLNNDTFESLLAVLVPEKHCVSLTTCACDSVCPIRVWQVLLLPV